jgi:hypothetical protein
MHGPGLQEDYLGLCSPRFGPALGRFSPPAHRFCQNPEGTLEATPGIALFNSLLDDQVGAHRGRFTNGGVDSRAR